LEFSKVNYAYPSKRDGREQAIGSKRRLLIQLG
jgi:hypothetical protein